MAGKNGTMILVGLAAATAGGALGWFFGQRSATAAKTTSLTVTGTQGPPVGVGKQKMTPLYKQKMDHKYEAYLSGAPQTGVGLPQGSDECGACQDGAVDAAAGVRVPQGAPNMNPGVLQGGPMSGPTIAAWHYLDEDEPFSNQMWAKRQMV